MYPTWPKRDECRTAGPDHMRPLWTPSKFQALVDACVMKLQQYAYHTPFDAIAGCGVSGVPLIGALAYRLGVPMIVVRKPGEKAHTNSGAQGLMFSPRYVIVDDLIETGSTIDHIINSILKGHEDIINWGATDSTDPIDPNASLPECVGIMLYHYKGIEYNNIPIIYVPGFYD